ncbi:MAG: hypothetical protein LC099_10330 [Anaerolineales bacterium]|nr:hypothetical protein [Anaerolineales bacterium]
MKKVWLVLLLIALFIFASYYYLFRQTQDNKLEGDIYNQFTGQWEKANIKLQIPDRSKVAKTDNSDGLHNYAVLKGYFDRYDESSQILHIRAAIAFTQNNLFEPAMLKLSPAQTMYCVPEIYTDPNTGKSFALRNLKIPVKDGEPLFVPGETIISFNDFVEQSNQLTLLLVQLTADFDPTRTNYVQKIVATGLCD